MVPHVVRPRHHPLFFPLLPSLSLFPMVAATRGRRWSPPSSSSPRARRHCRGRAIVGASGDDGAAREACGRATAPPQQIPHRRRHRLSSSSRAPPPNSTAPPLVPLGDFHDADDVIEARRPSGRTGAAAAWHEVADGWRLQTPPHGAISISARFKEMTSENVYSTRSSSLRPSNSSDWSQHTHCEHAADSPQGHPLLCWSAH